MLVATVLAYQGKLQEAAKLFCKANRVERAIDMFADLRKWDEARQFAHNATPEHAQELVRRQAQWAEETNDLSVAYQTYIAAGETMKAIHILGEQGWVEKLAEVARKFSKGDVEELRACLGYFEKHKAHAQAKDVLLKLEDVPGLLALNVENQKWDDAMALIEKNPELAPQVYEPYAKWLVEQDLFEEAQAAFKKAGHADKSLDMLRNLSKAHDGCVWSMAPLPHAPELMASTGADGIVRFRRADQRSGPIGLNDLAVARTLTCPTAALKGAQAALIASTIRGML